MGGTVSAPGARLFVYGTLRTGSTHPMHGVLANAARLQGRSCVRGELWDFGTFPGLVLAGDGVVTGELWWIHDVSVWEPLDRYEGVGSGDDDAFVRVAAQLLDREATAWVYAWPHATTGARRIRSGDITAPG